MDSGHSGPVDLDELLENAFWLAPLARALARDASSADDLVQDTWTAAAESPPRSREASQSRLASLSYEIAHPAGTTPSTIEIDLENGLGRVSPLRLHGTVARSSGDACARVRLYFEARFPDRSGVLVVRSEATANDEGHYEAKIIDAPRYAVRIYDPERSKYVLHEEWQNPGWTDEGQRDFRPGE